MVARSKAAVFAAITMLISLCTGVSLWASESFYFADAFSYPGNIYKLENGLVSTYYTRSSDQIYSLAMAPDGTIYFVDANDFDIYRLNELPVKSETSIYSQAAELIYIRSVEFDTQGGLYFSEATGSGGDGFIYRLENSQKQLFYQVELSGVDDYWAGNFAFDNANNLWLSSGNTGTSSLYKVVNGVPQSMFTIDEAIYGFFFEPDGNIVYADWDKHLYRLTVPGFSRSEIYLHSSDSFLSDVIPLTFPANRSIAVLSATVTSMSLGNMENSLVAKLDNAKAAFESGNYNAAMNILNSFINQVESQRGKKLTDEQAGELIASAKSIIESISANASPAPARQGGSKLSTIWGKMKAK